MSALATEWRGEHIDTAQGQLVAARRRECECRHCATDQDDESLASTTKYGEAKSTNYTTLKFNLIFVQYLNNP